MKNFTGVDDPYEKPVHPEVVVETDKETAEESAARIFAKLVELGYLEPGYVSQNEAARRAEVGVVWLDTKM